MNMLAPKRQQDLRDLLGAGFPIRYVADMLGISKTTALSYKKRLGAVVCPCGQTSSHRGMCRERLALYPGRQRFLRERWHRIGSCGVVPWDP